MNLTTEQQKVIDVMLSSESDNKIVAVNSVAGSGKTSTALAVVRALNPNKGIYTAFNKAIVQEATKKFPSNIEVKNIHALAYKYVKPKRIEDFTYTSITENISYSEKAMVIKALDSFYRSDSTDISEYLDNNCSFSYISDLVEKYANLMLQEKIPSTFNFMLKCFHLMLLDELNIDTDLVLLDEAQDTTAVTLEIFKNIHAKKKIMLGDTYQNIYSFMDTVNGFKVLKDTINLQLTKSFRCDEAIAEKVEDFGILAFNPTFRFKGTNSSMPSNPTTSYISRTNAALIDRMNECHENNITYSLVRPIKEIFELPLALIMVNSGKSLYSNKYKFLEQEYKIYSNDINLRYEYKNYYSYLQHKTQDIAVINACRLLLAFYTKGINIFDVMKTAEKMRPNKNTILTTAHAFKGLETDIVYLENDINVCTKNSLEMLKIVTDIDNLDSVHIENLNTYYVALSRARHKLYNNQITGDVEC